MKGFDGCILLKYLTENNVKPISIFSGNKITRMRIQGLKMCIIDSLNFLPMPLANFAKAFGLKESKGYFPHFFTRVENFDYVGRLPEPHFYGESTMSEANRKKFQEWYKEELLKNEPFNFAAAIKKYCRQDVLVLRDWCMAFKKIVMRLTHEKCDPFRYSTLAGVASAIFKGMYLKEGYIGAVPPDGYASHQRFSSESLEWLEFLRQRGGVKNLLHASNSPIGEFKIGPYQVDGIDKDNKTVYEYYGCFYHGCPKCCGKHFMEVNGVIGKTYCALYEMTKIRESFFKKNSWKMESIWACEWKEKKKNVEEIGDFVKKNKGKFSPINPFEAFYGGRVETFKMCVDDGERKMRYVDFTSLYPFVNATKKYPVGHPEIILSDFGSLDGVCDRYFGFIKCRILPPRKLYIPVLPGRHGKDKKLLFALCRTCAENRNGEVDVEISSWKKCEHSDEERALIQTWFSEEVKMAVKKGYKILEVYGIYHFEKFSTNLFSDYIRLFYKLKLISSGIPLGCENPSALKKYIEGVEKREKIVIQPHEFEDNPSMRQISKLLINSLWGRFGLRRNLPFHKFVSDFEEIVKMLNDPSLEITDIKSVHEDLVMVVGKKANNECLVMNKDANIYIAAATTAYARLELYEKMDLLQERVVYCDTDSIVYIDGEINLECGPYLGELTNELKMDDFIVRFLSGGPKNYAYETLLHHVCLKVKGFSMNYVNKQAFTLENMKKIIFSTEANFLSEDEEFDENFESVTSLPSSSSTKDKRRRLKMKTYKERMNEAKLLRDEAFNQFHVGDVSKPSSGAGEKFISVFNPSKITRENLWTLVSKPEQKLYTISYDKRVVLEDFDTLPFGF
jgi:hypothetical protein